VRTSRGAALGVVGMFAGVGGLERGLSLAGHHTLRLCEIDPAAQAVLRTRFPAAHLEPDVRRMEPLARETDLLAAGFPCQNLSPAGDTAGIRGAKSALVGEVFRLLKARRVPWVVLENVPFMLHLERGRAMRHVVEQLEKLGYRWAYRVVDAMAFGLPQRRRRVFLVASQVGAPEDVLFADDVEPPAGRQWRLGMAAGFYWTEGNRGVGWAVDAVPTLKGGSGLGIPSPPAVLLPDGRVVTPDLESAERLQGLPAGWTEPAERVGPSRFRWRMIGNAVNVRAAAWLGQRLRQPGAFDETRLGDELRLTDSWPVAACGGAGSRRAVRIGEWPERRPLEPIASFLEKGKPLSVRATEGFVSRAERAHSAGHLSFPRGFLPRLRAHLDAQRTALLRAGL
jgi:DNA (cytosine-5)-methyltransferase 1